MAEVRIDPELIPLWRMGKLLRATYQEIERIKRDEPEKWARVQARAKQLSEGVQLNSCGEQGEEVKV